MEHLSVKQHTRLQAGLLAGDPHSELELGWACYQRLRAVYAGHRKPARAPKARREAARHLYTCPVPEVARLGRFSPGYPGLSLVEPEPGSSAVPLANVASGSPAGIAGLQPGDVLVAVAGRKVASREQALAALLRQPTSSSLVLTVQSDGASRHVRKTPEQTFPSNHGVVTTLTVL